MFSSATECVKMIANLNSTLWNSRDCKMNQKWLMIAPSFAVAMGIMLAFSAHAANKPAAAPAIDFNREIRPILSENCFKCHGPDDQGRNAKLRFDRKEDAFKPAKSGDLAIV